MANHTFPSVLKSSQSGCKVVGVIGNRIDIGGEGANCNNCVSASPTEEEGPPLSTMELRSAALLQEMPFAVPFPVRVRVRPLALVWGCSCDST